MESRLGWATYPLRSRSAAKEQQGLRPVSFVPAPISRLADGGKDITRRTAELCGIAHAKPAADGTSSTAGLRLFLLQT